MLFMGFWSSYCCMAFNSIVLSYPEVLKTYLIQDQDPPQSLGLPNRLKRLTKNRFSGLKNS